MLSCKWRFLIDKLFVRDAGRLRVLLDRFELIFLPDCPVDQLLYLNPQMIPRLATDCYHNIIMSVLLEVLSETMAGDWSPTGFYAYHPIDSEESVALNPGIFSAFL